MNHIVGFYCLHSSAEYLELSLFHLHLLLPTLCFSPFLDEKLQEVPSQVNFFLSENPFALNFISRLFAKLANFKVFKVRKPIRDSAHKEVEDADYRRRYSRRFRFPAQPLDPMDCAQISRAYLNATLELVLFYSAAGYKSRLISCVR